MDSTRCCYHQLEKDLSRSLDRANEQKKLSYWSNMNRTGQHSLPVPNYSVSPLTPNPQLSSDVFCGWGIGKCCISIADLQHCHSSYLCIGRFIHAGLMITDLDQFKPFWLRFGSIAMSSKYWFRSIQLISTFLS